MKSVLFIFACITSFAFAYDYQNGQMQQQQEVQKDITSTIGPLPNHTYDIVLNSEFLYWYANITDLDYATKLTLGSQGDALNLNSVNLHPDRVYSVDTGWDPGCRLGLGIVTNHDGWDLYLDWTYIYNSSTSSQSVNPFVISNFNNLTDNSLGTEVLVNPWGFAQQIDNRAFNRIRAKWSILFHQFDLGLGRNFWIAKTLTLHPYVGLRGHWSRTHFNVHASYANNPDPALGSGHLGVTQTNNQKQKFWTVGLLTGLNSDWQITRGFSLFAQGGVSLTYGQFNNRARECYFRFDQSGVTGDLDTTVNYDDIYALITTLDLALGFRYEATLYEHAFRLLLDLGWENHVWIDFNHFIRNSHINENQFYLELYGSNLTMSGLVLRGRFEF